MLLALAGLVGHASGFVKPSMIKPVSNLVLRVANGDSSFSTESAGEATMRLGLNSAPTVWTEFGRLGQEHDPVNLGQGFPDWMPPEFAVEALVEAAQDEMNSPHQYTRPAGHPNLVNQLAQRYSTHMGRNIEPMSEVAVTVGASQALYLSLQTLIKPGT